MGKQQDFDEQAFWHRRPLLQAQAMYTLCMQVLVNAAEPLCCACSYAAGLSLISEAGVGEAGCCINTLRTHQAYPAV